jgi:hypothetical protein
MLAAFRLLIALRVFSLFAFDRFRLFIRSDFSAVNTALKFARFRVFCFRWSVYALPRFVSLFRLLSALFGYGLRLCCFHPLRVLFRSLSSAFRGVAWFYPLTVSALYLPF